MAVAMVWWTALHIVLWTGQPNQHKVTGRKANKQSQTHIHSLFTISVSHIRFGWSVWLSNLDGFARDTHKNVFLSESQMDKKWNPYICEYMWNTYYSAQCMCFASPSDILFSVVQHTKSYSYPNRTQFNCQKLYCRERLCRWLTPFSVFTFLVWVLWLQLNFLTPN